jgi:hypothetical protein
MEDKTDRWYFSNVVPAGITAKKIVDATLMPEFLTATPQPDQTGPSFGGWSLEVN